MTSESEPSTTRQLLKIGIELGPVAIFFFTNAYFDIFTATACFMVATITSLAASQVIFKKIAVMPLVTAFFVVVLGGLTLYLSDDFFIKIKPTIVNLLFATLLFGGLIYGQLLFKWLFGDVFQLTDEGWRILTIRWSIFFVVLAILNEIVWRNFSTDTWVSFKFLGIMPLTFVFAASQFALIQKFQLADDENTASTRE